VKVFFARNYDADKQYKILKEMKSKYIKEYIPLKDVKGLTGTARYISFFTHYGIE